MKAAYSVVKNSPRA